jgi:ubiquinone/menaquinone biosynthesis C-methylase UbiE
MNSMSENKMTQAIGERYSGLAEQTCCLSCGGALELADARPGEICVDLGSGRGTDVLRLAGIVGDLGFVYGVDTSKGMIASAKRNAEKLGIKNTSFIESTFESISIVDSSVDLVMSNCAINHAPDKTKVWSEVFRMLKQGGRFVVSDIYSSREVPEEYRNDPEAVAECWAGAVTREEYLTTLINAGFNRVRVIEESAPYSKGKIEVSSFTVTGKRPGGGCGCCK